MERYEDVASMVDHSLLRPQLTRAEVEAGLDLAKRYGVAAATMRPCDIDLAVRALAGTGVQPGSVAGFPHGSQNTATKMFETRDLLDRGAREIDMVIAISRLLSRDLDYVQTELDSVAELCHRNSAILKVIFENAYLTDEFKILACHCCGKANVDFVKTSTGFAPSGYTVADLKLMRQHTPAHIAVKAASGLKTLDQVLEVRALGVTRVGLTSTAAVLDEWKSRLASRQPSPVA
ncbi:MAG TPA: deoxyribose-phosphate aldolase [Bryobacteraceae bacterium]|nr:deoxyribose-phosphate aldolase [Bryobacteraceae bacterium]